VGGGPPTTSEAFPGTRDALSLGPTVGNSPTLAVGGGLDQLKKWESFYQTLLNAKPDEEKTEETVIGGKVVING
jgi:hypothetical protein